MDYTRPTLTPEQTATHVSTGHQINRLHDMRHRAAYIISLLIENELLLREVNEHRAARGIAPLPVFDNGKARIA